jgi:Lon protease-like protein
MVQTSLRLEDLPDSFPVFPLAGALLLPHGRLPLNIFEPRYLAMTEDALAGGRLLGMIQPDARRSRGEVPALYRVGCLGRIAAFSETDDSRYLITLVGMIRFAVAEELPGRRGYRRVRAALSYYAADLAAQPPHDPALDREGLLADLRGYFARQRIDANWDAIRGMADSALVTTLCMACPFDAAEKQALLEAPTEADRAVTLRALLAIDAHEAAPGSTKAS